MSKDPEKMTDKEIEAELAQTTLPGGDTARTDDLIAERGKRSK